MSEQLAIEKSKILNTLSSIESDLRKLGVKEGMAVLVHSSLSSIGWVCGAEQTVVEALKNILTEEGTLIMPTHSGGLSDPKYWECPPVPQEWWQQIRDTMPVFNPKLTPTRGMGRIVEYFRNCENVKRSYHPTVSFAAWGKHSERITVKHELNFGLGEGSPLQAIYDLNGKVLLLGVGYGNNTSLHLSEYYAKTPKTFIQGSPIMDNGIRVWQEYEDFEGDDDKFEDIGKAFEEIYEVATDHIGNADAKLINQRELVDFGIQWLQNR